MNRERRIQLECTDEKLTEEEIAEGWFFCCEWDGMLMTAEWPEAASCTCKNRIENGCDHDFEIIKMSNCEYEPSLENTISECTKCHMVRFGTREKK